MPLPEPTPALARQIVRQALGRRALRARRFRRGAQHFVYEVWLDDGRSVVARISRPQDRDMVRSAAALSRQLRSAGVPLPRLLFDGSALPNPALILERLPGEDLGAVAGRLSDGALREIARRVAEAQAIVAALPTAGRYGYAASADAAPLATWSEVVAQNLARSRARIAAAALFDPGRLDPLERRLTRLRPALDAVPATAFLHDTTTKNVIVTADGLFSGIVDVDDLCFGDPRFAPALTLASFLGGWARGGPQGYVEAWMGWAGHRDDDLFRFYVALFLADLLGELGHRFNGNQASPKPADSTALAEAFHAAIQRLG